MNLYNGQTTFPIPYPLLQHKIVLQIIEDPMKQSNELITISIPHMLPQYNNS